MTHDEVLENLKRKQDTHDKLLSKLGYSLKIEALWPEAFDHGTVKVGGSSTEHSPHLGTVKITRGDGKFRTFKAMDVPFCLWPDAMRAAFHQMPAHKRKNLERRLK